MLIAEEFLLIALDPGSGRLPLGAGDYVKLGLSGALLAELALAGGVDVRDGRVIATGVFPADPLLARVREAVAAEPKGVKPKDAVKRLDKVLGGVRDAVAEQLVDAGVLARHEGGLLSSTKYPVADTAVHAGVLCRVQAAAAGSDPLADRDAILLALAGPCRLLERVAPDRSGHRHAKARIKEASESAPFAPEVKKVIDELVATIAVMAALTASTAASS